VVEKGERRSERKVLAYRFFSTRRREENEEMRKISL
jgi:hypothetical protein